MPPWHPCLPLIEWCSCSKRLGKYRMDLSWIGHSVTEHSLSSCGSASKEEHICVKMSLETYKHPRNIMIAWKMYFLSNMPNFGIYVKFQGVNHAGLDCRELPSLDDVDTCWCQPAIWKTRHTKDSFHPNTQVWGFTNIWKTISVQKRLELVIRNGMEWTWWNFPPQKKQLCLDLLLRCLEQVSSNFSQMVAKNGDLLVPW